MLVGCVSRECSASDVRADGKEACGRSESLRSVDREVPGAGGNNSLTTFLLAHSVP